MKNKKILIIFFAVVFVCAILGFYLSKSITTYILLKDGNLNFGINKNSSDNNYVKIEEGRGKTLYINNIKTFGKSNIAKLQLHASSSLNKKISWKSSNTDLATVDSNGLVTIKKKLGKVNITASINNNKYSDTFKLILKEKTIVVITASQGLRMEKWFKEYTYKDKYEFISTDDNYDKDFCITNKSPKPGNLIYVCHAGTGSSYQYKTGKDSEGNDYGLTAAIKQLKRRYKDKEEYVDLTVFFTLSGNKIKNLTCKDIKNSETDEHKNYAEGYNSAINELIDEGYKNIKGIVMSHTPLNTIDSIKNFDRDGIVYSTNSKACDEGYRSGYKYYLSNKRMKKEIENKNYDNISYLDASSNILVIEKEYKDTETATFEWLKDENGVSYRNIYKTTDGLHWDETTTKIYMKLAFDSAKLK